MKPRPRRVENRVAQVLSEWYTSMGFSPVERIPVTGRTGPDIAVNELGLVVDAKSRLSCPKSYFFPTSGIRQFGSLIGVKLKELDLILTSEGPFPQHPSSIVVDNWYHHMDEYRQSKVPNGISALVLHRPGMRIAQAVFLISIDDKERLYERTLAYQVQP